MSVPACCWLANGKDGCSKGDKCTYRHRDYTAQEAKQMMVTARMSTSTKAVGVDSDSLRKKAKRMAETAAGVSGIEVVAVQRGEDPNIDMPHSRDCCGLHKFGEGALSDQIHCSNCYCYVHDVPAPCASWSECCRANSKFAYWQRRKREAKADGTAAAAACVANAMAAARPAPPPSPSQSASPNSSANVIDLSDDTHTAPPSTAKAKAEAVVDRKPNPRRGAGATKGAAADGKRNKRRRKGR
mmetsp:Transcript_38799/g.105318  ORF Transcript_38799/g.105318 Transcript_38799/m.105318 type:complete len:242 (+) Transcript_38799:264-989(+)